MLESVNTWCERESVGTQFAVFFSGISQPLNETFLMNEFNAARAYARVK